MPPGRLLIRADAGSQIGTGHVMRCMALAESWKKKGGTVSLLTRNFPDALRWVLEPAGVLLQECSPETEVGNIAREVLRSGAEWVVLDGYHLDRDLSREIKQSVQVKILRIDDGKNAWDGRSDIFLNPNLHAAGIRPSGDSTCLALCGPRFALIRDAARGTSDRGERNTAERLLIALGGSDPGNFTAQALERLAESPEARRMEIRLVAGGTNRHGRILTEIARKSGLNVEIHSNVRKMGDFLAWADVGLLSASTLFVEACAQGLPCLLVQIADNQAPILHAARSGELALTLPVNGPFSGLDFETEFRQLGTSASLRRSLSDNARKAVDGTGAGRVVSAMFASNFRLRPANTDDCGLLWQWANDPETRASSFHSGKIPLEDHRRWFEQKMNTAGVLLLMVETSEPVPFACCRFEPENNDEVISVNFAPEYRSLGLGSRVLKAASEFAFQRSGGKMIRAYIKPGNRRSLKAFEMAGFVRSGSSTADRAVFDWTPR